MRACVQLSSRQLSPDPNQGVALVLLALALALALTLTLERQQHSPRHACEAAAVDEGEFFCARGRVCDAHT